MEVARVAHELWSRRGWVAALAALSAIVVALVFYSVSLNPPGLHQKSLEYASARAQVLVDSKKSTVGDLSQDVAPLITRANIYSRLLASPSLLNIIGSPIGVSGSEIDAKGPYELNQTRIEQEPTAEKRSSQLIGEGVDYRLRFDSNPALPLITIYSEAPTVREAEGLANGAAKGLATYVEDVQNSKRIRPGAQVSIRQLGPATGATVNPGTDARVAFVLFLVLFGLSCLAVLAVPRMVASWRELRTEDAAATREDLADPLYGGEGTVPAAGDYGEFDPTWQPGRERETRAAS